MPDAQDYLATTGLIPGVALGMPGSDQAPPPPPVPTQTAQPAQPQSMADVRPPPLPALPQYQNIPQAPRQDFADPIKAFQNPAVVLATLGSLLTRAPLTTAMNAGGAAMEAFHKGDMQTAELKRKEWEDAAKQAEQQNKLELEKYKEAWERRNVDVKQKFAEMAALAAGYDDPLMKAAMASGDFEIAEKLMIARETAKLYATKEKERATAREEAKQEYAERNVMSDDAIMQMVERRLKGDKTVLTNVGRGVQGPFNIKKFNEMLAETMQERKISASDLAKIDQQYAGEMSYQRTAGTQGARVESASNEVAQLLPQAIETSRALPRGKFVPWNRLVQEWERGTSDPAYNDFVMANFSLINAYTRAMNPMGVPRVNDRLEQKANNILSIATSQQAYETQVTRLWKEVQASKKAVAETREGRTSGDITAPVPGMGKANDGWSYREK